MTDTTDTNQESSSSDRRARRGQARRASGARHSDGMKLLGAIMRDGSTQSLRTVDERWFKDAELPSYEFINSYYRRFNALPTSEALNDNGIVLPDTLEPVDYHLGRCQDRAIYTVLSENFGDFSQALRAMDMPNSIRIMRAMLAQSTNLQATRDLSDITTEANEIMDEYFVDKFRTGLKGITTGYPIVDQQTNGLQGGDVGILVGRPNLGKTYILLHMVVSAWLSGKSILFISMEMTTKQIVKRIIAIMASIDPYYLNRGRLSWHTERHVADVVRGFEGLPPIHFVAGKFRKTVSDINNYVLETSPDMIYIDGGYLVGSSRSTKGSSRHDKLTEVIEDIKGMAVDRDRPVMATVQFNREVRKNQKAAMDLAQIAGTDAIGQIASLVMGIQMGAKGNRTRTRIIETLKNREGDLSKFLVNFQFTPVDFSYLGEYEDEQLVREEEDAQQANALRNSMM